MPRKLYRSENTLHAALRRRDHAGVRTVVDAAEDRHALVNAKGASGVTPLMLAVLHLGNEAEATVSYLLEHGAATTVGAHGNSRRTAADYAKEHGLRALSESLQSLADEQIRDGLQGGGATWRDPCDTTGRCVLCGDRMGAESKFAVVRKQLFASAEQKADAPPPAESAPEPLGGRLIADFFADPLVTPDVIAALSVPALHHINRSTRFTRELQEALAMLDSLRHCIGAIGAGATSAGGAIGAGASGDGARAREAERQPWHVVDLCCGKSYVSAVVSCVFPHFELTAVDRLSPSYIPHYREAGISNVRYSQQDILSAGFAETLASLVAEQLAAGRPTVVLGMHLCGLLSIRAIELFHELQCVAAIVLSPCCLPAARQAQDTPPEVYAVKDPAEQYARWASFLERKLRGGANVACRRQVVEGLLSAKNSVLCAWRGGRGPC